MTATALAAAAHKQTYTLERPAGRLVYDVYEPHADAASDPILLIHGWGGTGSYWAWTAAQLASAARVIVPDLPGTGRSRGVNAPQNMYDQVHSLRALLDQVGVERVQLVGHSMGSAMGLLLTDLLPDRVGRVALTSLSFFISAAQQQVYRVVMGAVALSMSFRPAWLKHMPGMARMMAARYFYRIPDDPALLQQGWLDYLQLDYGTAVACANNASDPAIPAAGARLRVPVLLIACRNDQVMPPDNVDYTARVIPNCRVEWIENCGHLPMVEQRAEYLALLWSFLALDGAPLPDAGQERTHDVFRHE